jgi:membrane-associated phospholipid phosphatase
VEERTPRGRFVRPAIAIGGALAVGVATGTGRGRHLDRRGYRTINGTGGSLADTCFRSITEFGSIWASAGAASVLARRGWKRTAADAMGAALAMWVLGQLLKKAYRRPRPYRALEDVRLKIREPSGTSWPSSHPAVLLAFLQVAANDLRLSPAARSALAGLVACVGISRVYLGVHYPSDVIGGLLLGWGVAEAWSDLVSPSLAGADG